MITSRNLAFSSLRARLRLTRSAWLLAKTWAYEFTATSAVGVCPACSRAAGSVQRLSTWISRALFSVRNAGHSLLVAGCAPSQFGHLGDSLFGQSSCLWVPEHKGQISSVARQVRAPWPNCWGGGCIFRRQISQSQERCALVELGHLLCCWGFKASREIRISLPLRVPGQHQGYQVGVGGEHGVDVWFCPDMLIFVVGGV